jgi:protein-tyrosine-phosphatase
MVTPRVVFVCRRGAGRAPLALWLWRSVGGEGQAAGSDPAPATYPLVEASLRELGLEVDLERPRRLSPADLRWADLVVAMGARDEAVLCGSDVLEWSLPDVDWEQIEDVRRQRDAIAARVAELAQAAA